MFYIFLGIVALGLGAGVFVLLLPEPGQSKPSPAITMPSRFPRKRALLVGINKYQDAPQLRGCVNDVHNMWNVLTGAYGFDKDAIRVLTDERATKSNILHRLNWLFKDARAGDELVFHYSGHGSQVRDRSGDELADGMDEILCPYDLDWENPLKDDDLYKIFKKLPAEAFLTMICDSCHSGTISRDVEALREFKKTEVRFAMPPFDIQARSRNRLLDTRKFGAKKDVLDKPQRHVLISGCKDNQYSEDAYINGQWQGAFTAALMQSFLKFPKRSWVNIHKDVCQFLKENDYIQEPQLSGDEYLIARRMAFGAS